MAVRDKDVVEPTPDDATRATPEAQGLRRLRKQHVLWFVHARQPKVLEAWIADARVALRARGEHRDLRSRIVGVLQAIRLMWVSDAFGALALYRVQARAHALGIPIVPRLAHHLSIIVGQVNIGLPVYMEPGVLIPHGQVVIDGFTEIGAGAAIRPWVTIGLIEKIHQGPTLGKDVKVGTGARVLGPVVVGDRARIGANAVVLDDVAAGKTVVGAPARPVGEHS